MALRVLWELLQFSLQNIMVHLLLVFVALQM